MLKINLYIYIKFIKAICTSGRSITLILDDLQWVGLESLNDLDILIKDKLVKNLSIIGTYRDDEVNQNQPLALLLTLNDLDVSNVTKFKLQNLLHEDLNELISDLLKVSPLESYPLTALFHEQTKGNPFFFKQFLKCLLDNKLLFFDCIERKWKVKECVFGNEEFSDSVLELLYNKITSFTSTTQQVLKVASCLGSPFSQN